MKMNNVNITPDNDHNGLPDHIDFTTILPNLPEMKGADQVRIDNFGNVINGVTHVKSLDIQW